VEALAMRVPTARFVPQARAADRARAVAADDRGRPSGRTAAGLFHSDGCRVTNWTVRPLKNGPKRYEYPRYLFSNESADIIGLCTATLDTVGLRRTAPRPNLVSVARHDDVARLDQIVGPKS
jgi:hypothetical protein